jgi:hypothetical protein
MQNSLVVCDYEEVNGITMHSYFQMHIAKLRVYHSFNSLIIYSPV